MLLKEEKIEMAMSTRKVLKYVLLCVYVSFIILMKSVKSISTEINPDPPELIPLYYNNQQTLNKFG